ncbi:histidine phosphotransferase family protein [Altericroceibacterium xinjiangense]|uniref:histidine phosphotransferase family protein n=1 Tax=Altericroceibacterium xinjiangense TaxID=762261 RepID=UPI0019CFE210|nr:histidine phosphotransferase family protein [Altericroceibacterium xinjiangense]
MTSSVDLAAQLCSRLCHDLLSPVGALGNGLELLADERDPQMRQRCLDLLEQSARTSADKLKFFRLAYGAAPADESVSTDEPRALIERLCGSRIAMNWVVDDPKLPKPAIKVLLNLAAIGIDSLPRGGTLDLGVELRDEECEIVVRASGGRIALDDAVGRALNGGLEEADLTSRSAPAQMIRLFIAERGGEVQHMRSADSLLIGAVLPHA